MSACLLAKRITLQQRPVQAHCRIVALRCWVLWLTGGACVCLCVLTPRCWRARQQRAGARATSPFPSRSARHHPAAAAYLTPLQHKVTTQVHRCNTLCHHPPLWLWRSDTGPCHHHVHAACCQLSASAAPPAAQHPRDLGGIRQTAGAHKTRVPSTPLWGAL